jgi:hypothetical protein
VSGDQPPPGEPRHYPPPGQQFPPPGQPSYPSEPTPPPPTGQPGPYPGWGQAPPPSGWPSPGPGYPPYPYPGPYPPTAPVAHKPGAIPLRPLVLGDILDGAFRIIRYNPKATIGAAVLVSTVAMVLPVVVALVSGSTSGLRFDPAGDGSMTTGQVVGIVSAIGAFFLGTELQAVGLLYVSGMVAHVTSAAAVGRKLTMAQAWEATRGKRWRLLGMSLMLGLAELVAAGIVAGILVFFALRTTTDYTIAAAVLLGSVFVVCSVFYWIRIRALAIPALMLEPVGIFGALGRAFRLSARQFWRLFGILLLVGLIIGFAGSMLRLPFSLTGDALLAGTSDPGTGLAFYILLTAVGTVISSAVLQPFQAAISALLYVDQRIRKEAYDVELLGRAGILTG